MLFRSVVLGPTAERLVSLPSRECEGEEFANGGIGTAVVPLPLLLVPTTFLPQNDLNWFLNPFLVLKIIAFNPYNNRSMCGAMTLSVNLLMKAFILNWRNKETGVMKASNSFLL